MPWPTLEQTRDKNGLLQCHHDILECLPCQATLQQIADQAGYGRDHTQRRLAELADKGMIRITHFPHTWSGYREGWPKYELVVPD